MAKMKPKKGSDELPLLAVGVICERMLEESDQVVSIMRIVDTVSIPEPLIRQVKTGQKAGIILPLSLVLGFKAGSSKGKQSITIQLVGPKKTRERLGLAKIGFVSTVPGVDKEMIGANIRIPLGMPWHGFGVYWFEIEVGGKVITRIPLRIRRSEEATKG